MILTSFAFGQQFLWSTKKDSVVKHIPLEDVTNEVLEFFDHYDVYYDGAGFTKEGFFKMIESSQSYKNSNAPWKDLKKKIYEVNELTVFAFRHNLGKGSVVLVMCISKDNINLITFSNNYERDAILTVDREKFAKWFETLLN